MRVEINFPFGLESQIGKQSRKDIQEEGDKLGKGTEVRPGVHCDGTSGRQAELQGGLTAQKAARPPPWV